MLSVCSLSFMIRVYCDKTSEARIMRFSLESSLVPYVFLDKSEFGLSASELLSMFESINFHDHGCRKH